MPASRFAFAMALMSALAFPVFSQVKVDDKTDQIEALKIELEQARQNRDRVLARRWEDKQRDMEAREKFNRDYDDVKSKLELKNQEADRLHADIQDVLRDAEEAQARAEEERVRFLSLSSALRDRARDMAKPLERSFPARIPERIAALNRVLASAEIKRDAPGDALADLMAFQRSELDLSRAVSLEKRGFLRAGGEPGQGLFLRLGTVTAAYRDDSTGKAGLLLKNPPDPATSPFAWREALPPDAEKSLNNALTALEKESSSIVMVPMDVLLTQNTAKTYARVSDKGFWSTTYDTVKTGGVFLIPLVIVFLLAAAIGIGKLRSLRRAARGAKSYDEAVAMTARGDAEGVGALRARYPESPVFRALAVIALRRGAGRAEAEKSVRELLIREVPRLERGLTTLAVLAAAAPMLGLLGTISGLVAMFQVITELGVNDPKMLAGGIGEALITTETGLVIAIPALLLHNYLANRSDDLVSEVEYRATKALNDAWPG
jgi:biopolymer transport protein ExbB